jgi:hypothetical protein
MPGVSPIQLAAIAGLTYRLEVCVAVGSALVQGVHVVRCLRGVSTHIAVFTFVLAILVIRNARKYGAF